MLKVAEGVAEVPRVPREERSKLALYPRGCPGETPAVVGDRTSPARWILSTTRYIVSHSQLLPCRHLPSAVSLNMTHSCAQMGLFLSFLDTRSFSTACMDTGGHGSPAAGLQAVFPLDNAHAPHHLWVGAFHAPGTMCVSLNLHNHPVRWALQLAPLQHNRNRGSWALGDWPENM